MAEFKYILDTLLFCNMIQKIIIGINCLGHGPSGQQLMQDLL